MKLQAGQTATRAATLTAEHVQSFAELTGDYNPLPFDEQFAAKTKFGWTVQGGLTTGPLHARVATDLPGSWNGVPESGLAVHSAVPSRRYDHGRAGGRERSRFQTRL